MLLDKISLEGCTFYPGHTRFPHIKAHNLSSQCKITKCIRKHEQELAEMSDSRIRLPGTSYNSWVYVIKTFNIIKR